MMAVAAAIGGGDDGGYCCSNCVPTKSDEKISFSLAFF